MKKFIDKFAAEDNAVKKFIDKFAAEDNAVKKFTDRKSTFQKGSAKAREFKS